MTYEFGDYKVITSYSKGGIFSLPEYSQNLYYKNSLIYSSRFHSTEHGALAAARYEIERHKSILLWMNKNV